MKTSRFFGRIYSRLIVGIGGGWYDLSFFVVALFANIVRPFVQIYSGLVVGEGGGCVFFHYLSSFCRCLCKYGQVFCANILPPGCR